ncbi:MAG: hypothetical protein ACOCV8_01885 [Spirochaetota bacterium]
MKRNKDLILFIVFVLLFMACSVEKENKEKTAEKLNMEFPLRILLDTNNDTYNYNNVRLNPKSIYIDDSLVYLSINKNIYALNFSNKDEPSLKLKISKDKNNEFFNSNVPHFIKADNNGNIYVENIRIVEEEVKTEDKNKKVSKLKKTEHHILKYDYLGEFLYRLGPSGRNDDNDFDTNNNIEEMYVNADGNLSLIIKTYINLENVSYEEEEELDSPVFDKSNIDFSKYKFVKYNPEGKIIYTLDISNIKELNKSSDKYIRVIENVKLNPSGDKIFISTKDYVKKQVSDSDDYYINIENFSVYVYDLSINKLKEKPIKIEYDRYYMLGVDINNHIYLASPENKDELRFIVYDINGNIKENKKIIINNVRQKRYEFFFNKEGYIANAFIENDKIRIIQYK